MKNKLFSNTLAAVVLAVACASAPVRAFAAGAPPVQDQGSTSTGTVTTVAVSTNITLLLSTGAFVNVDPEFRLAPSSMNVQAFGTHMYGRIGLEIQNNTSLDIYCSFISTVTAHYGNKMGRKVAKDGGTWSVDGSNKYIYAVASGTTQTGIVITQVK